MSNQKSNPHAQKFFTPLEHRLAEEQERVDERQALLDKQYGRETAGGDAALPSNQRHDYDPEKSKHKNFDQKVYYFPESFNALRRELDQHWQTLFYSVNPEMGKSLAWCMAFDAPTFVGVLNGALDLTVQFDSDNVSGICHTFLNALRAKRGVSPISA